MTINESILCFGHFGAPSREARYHLVGLDGETLCGKRAIWGELCIDDVRHFERWPICLRCTQAKAGYLDNLRLQVWQEGPEILDV